MIVDLVAAIDININPSISLGGLSVTWHGIFTAVGIALGVWLSFRLARGKGFTEDDVFNVALVAVPSGIVGARALWVLEHTDRIDSLGDIFRVTDGGISVYGAMIAGVVGGMIYILLFRRQFPKFLALDIAAPGMILGQAVGRFGDLFNGEHFAEASGLPWAFRYTHPQTEGPWVSIADGIVPASNTWERGQTGALAEAPVPVHPVAGGYEPILDLMILGVLLYLRRTRVLPGWSFLFYVVAYGAVRGLLALLRTDEQTIGGALSVPQLLAILTGAAAAWMAWYLFRHPQQRIAKVAEMTKPPARPPTPAARAARLPGLSAGPPKRVRVRRKRRR